MTYENKLREEICRIGQSLFNRGYTVGTAGNLSCRLPAEEGGGWLITPTDACLGFLDPAALAKVSAEGVQMSGDRASKTLVLHRAIYRACAEAMAVVHTHSTHLVALSMAGVWDPADVLPPITPYYVMKVGHVPLIPYRRPGAPEVADMVCQHIPRSRAVLLERLGPVVWHKGISEAAFTLEELEETAKLWMILKDKPLPLAAEAVTDLQHTFGANW